jgi:hypothetical protein
MNNHNVEYILVGGYAVIPHGYRRVTSDMYNLSSVEFESKNGNVSLTKAA